MLRRAGGEAHVPNSGPSRFPFRGSNGLRVGIHPVNPCGERRDAQRQPAVAAPEVQNALPAHERRAAPLPELVLRTRPESRRHSGDVPANVADRVRCDTARHRQPILALDAQSAASLSTGLDVVTGRSFPEAVRYYQTPLAWGVTEIASYCRYPRYHDIGHQRNDHAWANLERSKGHLANPRENPRPQW